MQSENIVCRLIYYLLFILFILLVQIVLSILQTLINPLIQQTVLSALKLLRNERNSHHWALTDPFQYQIDSFQQLLSLYNTYIIATLLPAIIHKMLAIDTYEM